MSVLVKGMEKPEHCGYCRFRYDGICHALQKTQYSMDECPLEERKKGSWITYYHGGTNFSYSCNQCGADAPFLWNSKDQKKTRYCYNCGARMEDPKLEISSLYGKCVKDGEE